MAKEYHRRMEQNVWNMMLLWAKMKYAQIVRNKKYTKMICAIYLEFTQPFIWLLLVYDACHRICGICYRCSAYFFYFVYRNTNILGTFLMTLLFWQTCQDSWNGRKRKHMCLYLHWQGLMSVQCTCCCKEWLFLSYISVYFRRKIWLEFGMAKQ